MRLIIAGLYGGDGLADPAAPCVSCAAPRRAASTGCVTTTPAMVRPLALTASRTDVASETVSMLSTTTMPSRP